MTDQVNHETTKPNANHMILFFIPDSERSASAAALRRPKHALCSAISMPRLSDLPLGMARGREDERAER
jgi:hypothetical protein